MKTPQPVLPLNESVAEVDASEPHDFNVKVTFLGSGWFFGTWNTQLEQQLPGENRSERFATPCQFE